MPNYVYPPVPEHSARCKKYAVSQTFILIEPVRLGGGKSGKFCYK